MLSFVSVYTSKHSARYHRSPECASSRGCLRVKLSVDDALDRGLHPCQKCNPPKP